MKRKYLILAAAGIFLLIAGICYSCIYKEEVSYRSLQELSNQQINRQTGELEKENSVTLEAIDDFHEADTLKAAEKEELTQEVTCYVHICGAVKSPGVYQVQKDCRLIDLVKQAGGFTSEAAEAYINQAIKVQDGQRIYIPTEKEVKELSVEERMAGDGALEMTEQAASGASGSKLININTATAEELMELPGVGEAKAASIIEYRNTKGNFKTIQELMKISGIKEGLYQKVSSYITVK